MGTFLSCQAQPYLGGSLNLPESSGSQNAYNAHRARQCILSKNADESMEGVQNCVILNENPKCKVTLHYFAILNHPAKYSCVCVIPCELQCAISQKICETTTGEVMPWLSKLRLTVLYCGTLL